MIKYINRRRLASKNIGVYRNTHIKINRFCVWNSSCQCRCLESLKNIIYNSMSVEVQIEVYICLEKLSGFNLNFVELLERIKSNTYFQSMANLIPPIHVDELQFSRILFYHFPLLIIPNFLFMFHQIPNSPNLIYYKKYKNLTELP